MDRIIGIHHFFDNGSHKNNIMIDLQDDSVAIVSYDFIEDSQNSRPLLVYKVLKNALSKAVFVYCASFSHHKKQQVQFFNPDVNAIAVPAYKRNISIGRIISYWVFAFKVLANKKIKCSSVVYFCVPANELAIIAFIYKIFYRKKVILDVIDLWPDAFPFPKLVNPFLKQLFLFTNSPARNFLFKQADLTITQSKYFKSKLSRQSNTKVVLMGTDYQSDSRYHSLRRISLSKELNILYLGSINAINDLSSLLNILSFLREKRKIHLSVIGGGKRLNFLRNKISELGISSTFHGVCFDSEIKNCEFMKCHFGYNGYVNSTEVAISYKSLEYLAHGLPLLNSTKGDTYSLVKHEKIGFNFSADHLSVKTLCNCLLDLDDIIYREMQENCIRVFESNFAWGNFRMNLLDVLTAPPDLPP